MAEDDERTGSLLEQYTSELQPLLLQLAQQEGFLRGPLLETADLDELWPALAQPYMASAVPDFEQYPLVSLGWMTFVGMAMAVLWDEDWQRYQPLGSALYTQLRDARGWDELDEYVLEDVLGMLRGSEEAKRYTDLVRRLAELALTQLRHENAEPSSPMAFQLYARTLFGLYRIGVALGLARLGYKLTQANKLGGECAPRKSKSRYKYRVYEYIRSNKGLFQSTS